MVNLTKNACIDRVRHEVEAKSFTSGIQRPSVRSRRLSKPGGSVMRSLQTTETLDQECLRINSAAPTGERRRATNETRWAEE
jgi:hypothetical protein